MGALTVSIPMWGDSYVQTFKRVAAPALLRAVAPLVASTPVRFLVHTDQPDRVRAALAPYPAEVRHVPNKSTYVALQESHADAVRRAVPGDPVALLNADLVVSENFFARGLAHLAAGKDAVVLLGIRTAAGPEAPPAGAAPRALLAWAWEHRHQIIRDLEWPHGGSMIPTNLFFAGADGAVVARGFHLHPAVIRRRPETQFSSTIDGDLLDCYPRDRIHVVVDPDDCAMLEVSPPERRFPVRGAHFTARQVAMSMQTRASPMHCWLFKHRIIVRGRGEDVSDDRSVVREVLRLLSGPLEADRPPEDLSAPLPPRGSPRASRAPAGRRLHPYRRPTREVVR